MTVLLSEMTREEIRRIAPQALAVLPTASIEQHGPHLPVYTDSLIVETIARRAAEQAAGQISILVAPTLCYGNSHHHFPFPGVLSLPSDIYIAALTGVLESLVRGGFRKLVVLNGHGGNSEANTVVGLDLVNRLGHAVSIATTTYWDVARSRLAEKGLMPKGRFPGHAGYFETSLVLAIRPDLVDRETLAQLPEVSPEAIGLYGSLSGATVQIHGAWAAGSGYTDCPASASAEDGKTYLDFIVECVADFLIAGHARL